MRINEVTANRIRQLCRERNITPNRLSYLSAVPQATIKSILAGESKNVGIITVKKLCDGLGISVVEFFDTEEFNNLEQEIV
ncbi:MAG: transcriptional regulator [Clostridiales bacterium]|nr:MAG: transcriptional regulator [Clostridiales bacterium]